jgi:hypothetical protein
LNYYCYGNNSPLSNVDPSGCLFGIDDLIIGAVVFGIIGAEVGGTVANHGNFNPVQWDWTSPGTYLGVGLGAFIGAAAGYAGVGLAEGSLSASVGVNGAGVSITFTGTGTAGAGGTISSAGVAVDAAGDAAGALATAAESSAGLNAVLAMYNYGDCTFSDYMANLDFYQYACNLEGSPYLLGGKDPTTGIDCSGLAVYSYNEMGGLQLDINNTSAADLYSEYTVPVIGPHIPGDLRFFMDPLSGTAYHVQILGFGNGRLQETSMNGGFWQYLTTPLTGTTEIRRFNWPLLMGWGNI